MKSIFPLPKMRDFRENYQDICEQRAVDLLKLADTLDVGIYVFWSGGVDSTCALASLLKHCKEPDRLTVLMNEDSVLEYPLFYAQHVRKLRCQPTSRMTEVFVENALVINGECNDQLFGSDIFERAIALFGIEAVMAPLKRELITSLYQHGSLFWLPIPPGITPIMNPDPPVPVSRENAVFLSGLMGRLLETAPVDIRTNFELLWWINFVLKWQTVILRPLIFSKFPVSAQHIKTYYHPFFNTDEFQLWSMNNMDKRIRIKEGWRSYKWPCKDAIYSFTGDAEYRDYKKKFGSLRSLLLPLPFHKFIDEGFSFREEFDWYEPQNDFTPATFDPSNRSLCEDAQSQRLLTDSRPSKPDGDILLEYAQRALY